MCDRDKNLLSSDPPLPPNSNYTFNAGNAIGYSIVVDRGADAHVTANGTVTITVNYQVGNKTRVDYSFISKYEGGQQRCGYVPKNKKTGKVVGKSGVTVGTGFDIGQHSPGEIDRLDIPVDLKQRLKPYTTSDRKNPLVKQKAVSFLASHPFCLSQEDLNSLDNAELERSIRVLQKEYDKTAKGRKFSDLPTEAQTVLADLHHQYGDLAAKRSFKQPGLFWDDAINQRWQKATDRLYNFGDQYSSRRKSEGNLLHKAIDRNAFR